MTFTLSPLDCGWGGGKLWTPSREAKPLPLTDPVQPWLLLSHL